jgi:hypothetical protein
MRTRYQIIKKRNKHFGEQIILHPNIIGDEIYEFDTIELCESKIKEIENLEMYIDVMLSIKEVYYTD